VTPVRDDAAPRGRGDMDAGLGDVDPGAVRVAGSLWSVPSGEQPGAVERLRAAGLAHLHWDFSDGHFAAAGGFSADEARAMTAWSGLVAEAHLMAVRPLEHVDLWTDFCDVVVVHAEAEDWRAALRRIESRGARPALAISPGTPPAVAPSAELAVLTMSVQPGRGGSPFDRRSLSSVAALRASGPSRLLGMDGGVTQGLGTEAVAAGANWLVSGTDLFGTKTPERWLGSFRVPVTAR
jgi:ribulose-phosphate 3-epimerase